MVQLLGALDAVRASVDAQREVGVGVIEVLEGEVAVAVVLREEFTCAGTTFPFAAA